MREFIYRLEPVRPAMLGEGPTPEEERVVGAHFAHLQAATRDGTVLLAGRTDTTGPESFGIVVFRAEDAAAAEAFVRADPAVAGGVMRADLLPFRVALMGGWTTG